VSGVADVTWAAVWMPASRWRIKNGCHSTSADSRFSGSECEELHGHIKHLALKNGGEIASFYHASQSREQA
jgi:hypothetical protein